MKRPMAFAAVSFIIGIVMGRYISSVEYIAFILMTEFLCCFVAKRNVKTDFIFSLPIFTIIGFLIFSINNKEIKEYSKDVFVRGLVLEASEIRNEKQSLVFKADEMSEDGKERDFNYNINVYLEEGVFVKTGDLLVIEGRIYPPQVPANDGGFDSLTYMKSRGYDFTMYAKNVTKFGERKLSFFQRIYKFRERVNDTIDIIYPPKEAGIIKAMVTGETSGIDNNLKDLYREGGISHILAVSGIHTSIVAGLMLLIFDVLKINRRKSSAVIIFMLIMYIFFAGARASVIRAVLMVIIMLLGCVFYRIGDALSSLATAAIVILLINPWQLWEVGFQLSFISVLSLILIGGRIKKVTSFWEKSLAAFKLSVGVSLATLPIVAWYFYEVPIMGAFANIFVLPLSGVVVGFAMVSGISGVVNPWLGVVFAGPAIAVLKIYETICTVVGVIPFSNMLLGRPKLISIFIFYISFYFFYRTKKKSIKTFVMPFAFSVIFVISINTDRIFKINTVDFLDVGQGDCAILRSWDKKAYIFDTGGYSYKELGENTGTKIIIPYLRSHGIDEVEYIFISHIDSDHMLGALEVINEYKVKGVFISGYEWESQEYYNSLLDTAVKKNIEIVEINSQVAAKFGNGIEITCLYPYEGKTIDNDDDNSGSLVLKLDIGKKSFLFTGDIGTNDESLMIYEGENLKADVLKVPHHGSKNSSSSEFLDKVGMDYSVISCSKNNIYGHPSSEVMERLKATGSQVFETYNYGMISFITNGEKMYIKTNKEVIDGQVLE